MPRNDFPVRDQHVDKPILIIGVHRPVTTANFPDSPRVPWRHLCTAAASLGTPVGIGILHPILGEALAVIEVVAVLTIIATALFASQALSERAFRLLRWFGNRPEPPPPGGKQSGGLPTPTRPTTSPPATWKTSDGSGGGPERHRIVR
jgi:hypothetical protein